MRKIALSIVVAVFAFGATSFACTSGLDWMNFLPPEDRAAIADYLTAQAQNTTPDTTPPEEQVPPPPPPPLFVQADPLTPPELWNESADPYPAQAPPIEMEEVVVIS